MKPRSADLCNGNDSISSVDSCGKDDANSILEQCIQSGINNVVKKDKRTLVTSSPKRSMLPTYNNKPGPSKVVKTDRKVQDKRDEELLQECINTGIMKNTRQEQIAETPSADPKNVETTSVVIAKNSARVPIITAGVELKAEEKSTKCKPKTDRDENIASKSQPSRQESGMTPSGFDLNLSMGSVDENVLERSNEYPAVKMSIGAYVDLDDDSMNISNEFMMESEKISRMENKHKDPDLMMKSVDRLTHELVSTAEYLRRNTISDEISKMSGSNTWTDENSFPSISMSAAPMIASTNEDVTIATDQIYTLPEEIADQKFEDKTPMNENYIFEVNEEKIHVDFRVGGEIGAQPVAKVNFMSFGPMSIETCSTMSNSTIVQVEAKRIANKLNSMTNRLMDSTSSLDLENVRPPSSMDCISMSSFHESTMQQSPMRKKPLMPGIVAKRALGHQMFSASAESVNIDSIRPPSIMDELLDSMISVDSIVSEIVDPITMGISNYETAISDMEDSLTMRSCQDLSKDEETLTANSSDFSSVESTPKKRNLTPRQKRQSEKDRYKTYTIQVDMLLKESSTESARKSLNARQRRQEDRTRFETQVISPKLDDSDKTYNIEDDLSIQAMTKNFKFIRAPINHTTIPKNNGEIRNKLNQIRQNTEESLEEERQNSETESQRDLKNSLTYEANLSVEIESPTDKPKLTKNSYISPYRMTSRLTPMKNKSVKVTKTPIIAKIVTRKSPVDLKPAIQKKPAGLRVNTNIKKTFNQPSNVPKSAPVIATTKEAPSIVRQGTFVKDEPTMENVPIVVDLPQKSTISKLKPPTKVSSPKILEKTPLAKKVSNLPTSISQLKFRSNSNASMKTPILTPVRSNTGINLNNPKKSVTSKIAGIWKSGEKKDSLLKKPSISASASQLNPPGKLFGSSARNVGKNKEIMKRSSTYDELGEDKQV